jgi:chromosomal replication initiator protein
VCIHFGVLLKDLNSRRRTQQIAHARQVAMYITRRVLHLSYPMMGELFRRDHSTCVYAVKRITQQSKRRPEYGRTIDALALVVQNVLRAALSPKLALLAAIEKRGALAV